MQEQFAEDTVIASTSAFRPFEQTVTDNLENLLSVLPPAIADAINALGNRDALLEIVLDLGRLPSMRYAGGEEIDLEGGEVTRADLAHVAERIGRFGDDNRAGIERTLHRISAIRNRKGEIVGLTCRIGRAVYGTVTIIRDLIESGESVLMLGRPGVGKTTILREAARVISGDLQKRVVIVDTSNEIAGDGDIPHPSIGRARRMQVPTPTAQHGVMIEAVENHMPQVIVIDEIGTQLEAEAARTIAERGVQLIGTAHGNTLENLMLNPTLSDLIGGIQTVTLSDEEARRRGTQKSILERKAPPTFTVMVELQERDQVAVYTDVAGMVDATLRGQTVEPEVRHRTDDGGYTIISTAVAPVGMGNTQPLGRSGRPDRGERGSDRAASGRDSGSNRGASWGDRPERHDGRGGRDGRDGRDRRPAAALGAAPPMFLAERTGGRNAAAKMHPEAVSPMERLLGMAPSPGFGGSSGGSVRGPEMTPTLASPSGAASLPVPMPHMETTLSVAERRAPSVHELRDPVRRGRGTEEKPLRIYPFGVSRNRLEEAILNVRVAATLVRSLREADAVMTLKNYYRRRPQPLVEAEVNGTPVYVLRTNTTQQMETVLANVFEVEPPASSAPATGSPTPLDPSAFGPPTDPQLKAMEETEVAINDVLTDAPLVQLRPQSSYIRRLQHQMAERYNLRSRSKGQGNDRHVEIYRTE